MGWKPFKAIVRAFTPNPQSFTPANIARVASAITVGVYSGGLASTNPKIGNTVIATTNPEKPAVINAAYTGASSLGQATVTKDPETTVNKISRLFGGAVASLAIGSAATNVITTPASASVNALPTGVQGPTQGFTFGESFGNFAGSTISTTATAFGTGQFAQGVIGIFGKQVGGAILQLLSGDIAGAIKTISTPPPNIPTTTVPNLYGNYQSGGGGGAGLGVGSGGTGQSTTNPLVFPAIALGLLAVLWLVMRKK